MNDDYQWLEDGVWSVCETIATGLFVAIVGGVVLPLICIFNPEHQREKRAQHRR